MRHTRVAAGVAALAIAIAAALVLLAGAGGDYTVRARFQNASQIVKGNLVQVAGRPVGAVADVALTRDGQAELTLEITDERYAPLRRGTRVTVRQASLSGVANRYLDLGLPPGAPAPIPDGGTIAQAQTATAVDLDQVFNLFDPATRRSLRGVVRGFAGAYAGQGERQNRGLLYLNPSLAASSRLVSELDRDTGLFERFVVASSRLVTDVADRRDALAGLVDHLATTMRAIGRRRTQLAGAVGELPPFMRRANSTFVDLRAALDDLDPLVRESRPVARRLRPLLARLRPLARDGRPTLRDLSAVVRRRGRTNDLVELTRGAVGVRDAALRDARANGARREGAFPATVRALSQATPELADARPYAVDLTGWFDDFSHSGVYDALGGVSRVAPSFNAFEEVDGVLSPQLIPAALRDRVFRAKAYTNQRNRCPGAMEPGAAFKPGPDFNCDLSQRLPGP